MYDHLNLKVPYAPIYRSLSLKPNPAASSVVVRYKCINLYISANIQPIQLNEHFFCTILNAPDCGIVINAILC